MDVFLIHSESNHVNATFIQSRQIYSGMETGGCRFIAFGNQFHLWLNFEKYLIIKIDENFLHNILDIIWCCSLAFY